MQSRRFAVVNVLAAFVLCTPSLASGASVTLAWDPPVDGIAATSYSVQYGTTSHVYTTQLNVGGVTTFRVDGLVVGTRYCFVVRGSSSVGTLGDPSGEVCTTAAEAGSISTGGGASGAGTSAGSTGSSGSTTGSGTSTGTTGGGAGTPAGSTEPSGSTSGSGATSGAPESAGTSAGSTESSGSSAGAGTTSQTTRTTSQAVESKTAPRAFGVAVSERSARFSWQAPADGLGATSYLVELGSASGASDLNSATVAAFSVEVQNLSDGTYYARVFALRGAAKGEASPELKLTIRGGTQSCAVPPSTPGSFVATSSGALAQLSWQPGTGEAPNSYLLHVGSAAGRADLMVVPLGANPGLNATASDGVYYLRVFALNTCGISAMGADAVLTIGVPASGPSPSGSSAPSAGPAAGSGTAPSVAALPGAPEALTQQVNGNVVTLGWKTPRSGSAATHYIIEVINAGLSVNTGNTETTFTHVNTPPGEYLVRLRAGNAAGVGPASDTVTIVVR